MITLEIMLLPQGSRVLDLIINLSYCLCEVSRVLPVTMWVSFGFLHTSTYACQQNGYANLSVGVNVSVQGVFPPHTLCSWIESRTT